ncbi:glycerol kinase GlpK [Arachidicoccus ginsenosidivorans]|uniref:Glycerol kinase n=1 Tax=Arachidicoccus ginsenosidivorans TaxID=496057 RepID=A0A5B8VGR0_9BACT|nr:glycerol kinase GlpK [Arachidicoccus ginsenosidivorans]QEC70469.1 glycerol kinase GlpK [Arachidicoccus ginsenosidivorans]
MEKYILTLDQGTTSSRAILFNHIGAIVSLAQKEFTQIYPKPGWVEHDPMEIWSSQASVITEAVLQKGVDRGQLAAIGITNQRETTIVWDRQTGAPVYNAIVWQDRRTAAVCDALKAKGKADLIQEKTGLIVDAYFSGTKIKWILDNVAGARSKAEKGELAFGTVDSWLIWNLTGGKLHITDVTNASRTMLFNIHTLKWDETLLSLLDIPAAMLPEVKSSSEVYGLTSGSLLGTQVPIAGIAGDQQSALFGHMCNKPGMVKNTYGTGCFMLMNIGSKPTLSKNNLITTIAWQIGNEVQYALEGSIFIAGAVVQWLRDELKMIVTAAEIEKFASAVPDTAGVYMVPAFAGLGAPHWNQDARGAIFGITRGANKDHFCRAALESIAYQTMDVLTAMQNDAGLEIRQLRVDGGATSNNLLLQFQADILKTEVLRPNITEITAIGAAYLAGLAVGFWENMEAIEKQWQVNRSFQPEGKDTEEKIKGWQRAVTAVKAWTSLE